MRRALVFVPLVALACSSDPSPLDGGGFVTDAEVTDSGTAPPDSGATADAGPSDTGPEMDAGFDTDAGFPDAGFADAGFIDAGFPDSGVPDAGQVATCQVSLCMAGAFTREDGANPWFRMLCEQLPGLVRDGTDALFSFSDRSGAKDALIAALDNNADGRVDAADPACDVILAGYSWGGVNTTVLGQEFVDDSRVAPERARIARMFTIDPYAPTAGRTVEVPAEVEVYYELRHSTSPNGDCSENAPLGPYRGLPPLCYSSSDCHDFDYSLAPSLSFVGAQYVWRGDEIGHCSVVDVAAPAILHMVQTGTEYPDLPPSVAVGAR